MISVLIATLRLSIMFIPILYRGNLTDLTMVPCPGPCPEKDIKPGFKHRPACHSLTVALPCLPAVQQERTRELWAREIHSREKKDGGNIPPPTGLIKCLINSRRRIRRNNEHLSESFIACKSLSPASSHLIFTASLGGRCCHYPHFTAQEREALTPPSLGGHAVHLWVGSVVW